MMSMTKCPSDCVDGCHCPQDMYYNKEFERCVKREQCSCYWDGIHYAHLTLRRGDIEERDFNAKEIGSVCDVLEKSVDFTLTKSKG